MLQLPIFLQNAVSHDLRVIPPIIKITEEYLTLSVGALAADIYAKKVVAQTLMRHTKAWFWVGKHAFTCWLLDTFTGRRGFVCGIIALVFIYPSEYSGLDAFSHVWTYRAKEHYSESEEAELEESCSIYYA
jgi:hypothetical protein